MLEIYSKNRHWKFYFLLIAIVIVLCSIFYTSNLVDSLAREEAKKVELWAAGLRSLDANPNQDVNLIKKIMEENETIPVILVNGEGHIVAHRNITFGQKQEKSILEERLNEMKEEDHSIVIDLVNGKNYIYFDDSNLLKRLVWYPFVQLGAIITFIVIAYLAFSYSKSAEQNQVWVGMSKETAHQLGTPISSLMAWMELIKEAKIDPSLVEEMAKDVSRLEVIAERFSKIGSKPVLQLSNVVDVLESSIEYMQKRTSNKIKFTLQKEELENEIIAINKELFSWVIENLVRNAVDAMEGKGQLKFLLSSNTNQLIIDISDTGKGVARNQFKTIFKPGFTSKKRGWGLGLSLSKRIIENYHRGKIFVASSELGNGAVFRLILPLN